MEAYKTTMGDLPYAAEKLQRNREFSNWYFTVGTGKADYVLWSLANNSCGLYYCYRPAKPEYKKYNIWGRRAVEPNKEVTIFYTFKP